MTASRAFVVEAVRGDLVESTHLVDVAVADPEGTLLASAGEPHTVAFLRSVSKPIQATVCTELGWDPPGDPQLAVACASHNGEEMHVEAARTILAAADVDEPLLRCPPAMPSVVGTLPPPDAPRRIYHNCSGKHAAMLATMVANGWDPHTYQIADNELQRAIRARIEGIMGTPARAVAEDGCGVPTFAFALSEAAAMYARMPADTGRALDAMRAHPRLVAGSNRICSSVMSRVPAVVLKVGAEGLMCGVLLESQTGFALKARDGAARGREIAALRVLDLLGALGDIAPDRIVEEILPRVVPEQRGPLKLRCSGELKQA
jgi:L-asparaginase II